MFALMLQGGSNLEAASHEPLSARKNEGGTPLFEFQGSSAAGAGVCGQDPLAHTRLGMLGSQPATST